MWKAPLPPQVRAIKMWRSRVLVRRECFLLHCFAWQCWRALNRSVISSLFSFFRLPYFLLNLFNCQWNIVLLSISFIFTAYHTDVVFWAEDKWSEHLGMPILAKFSFIAWDKRTQWHIISFRSRHLTRPSRTGGSTGAVHKTQPSPPKRGLEILLP